MLLLILAALCVGASSRTLPHLSSFSKELSFVDKRIVMPDAVLVSDEESFVYASCESQEKTFRRNRCNVTVETPALADSNATFLDHCSLELAAGRLESLSELHLHVLSDERVLLTWLVKDDDDHRTKSANVRVLKISNCQAADSALPAEKIHAVVAYDTGFDVVASNRSIFPKESFKLSFDLDGKRRGEPTRFVPQTVVAAAPSAARQSGKPLHAITSDADGLRLVSFDGKPSELLKVADNEGGRMSNAHELLGICWSGDERTKLTCRQYDPKLKLKLKLEAVLRYPESVRRYQPHNLPDGGMLLVTATPSGKLLRNFEEFRLRVIHPNGQVDRPLVIQGLNLECTNAEDFRINVSENSEGELCVHYVCVRNEFERSGTRSHLTLGSKCLSKLYLTAGWKRAVSSVN